MMAPIGNIFLKILQARDDSRSKKMFESRVHSAIRINDDEAWKLMSSGGRKSGDQQSADGAVRFGQ